MVRRSLLVVALVLALCFAVRHLALDDALIYDRYVRNALAGQGPVYNAGERINALTSPLYGVLLLAASWLLRGHVIAASMALSAMFLIAAAYLAERIAPWSGVLIAATAYFYFCFGMETPLFLFMLILCLWLYLEEKFFWLPLACLLTMLTRAEGVFIALPLVWHLWRRGRMPSFAAYLAPAAVTAAYLWFNVHFYGRLLPASGTAKLLHGRSGYFGRWPTAFLHHGSLLLQIFRWSIYVIPAALVLSVLAFRKLRGTPINGIVPPFLARLLSFYLLLNVPNYHWYNAPFIFFGLLYAVLGMPRNRITYAIFGLVIAECAITGYLTLVPLAHVERYQRVAEWLDSHASPDAKVAAVEIGTLGWYCPNNIDDIVGLTNPANARLLAHRDLTTWLETDKPDYVIVHTVPAFGETAAVASPRYAFEPVTFDGVRIMHRLENPALSNLNRP